MSPIEQAARAIAEYYCEDPDAIDPPGLILGKQLANWRKYAPVAAAVLAAIREPSEEMIQAAADCESSLVSDVYTAMIDAAMAE